MRVKVSRRQFMQELISYMSLEEIIYHYKDEVQFMKINGSMLSVLTVEGSGWGWVSKSHFLHPPPWKTVCKYIVMQTVKAEGVVKKNAISFCSKEAVRTTAVT